MDKGIILDEELDRIDEQLVNMEGEKAKRRKENLKKMIRIKKL